jgi:hypothetical protein
MMSFSCCAHSSLKVLADQVGTFRWVNVTFLKLQPPPFNWETPFLQPICHEIKRLHSIFSNDLNNILSPISYHCTFKFHADWVDTFKRMNVELQTFKLNKNGSNWKVCTLSTMIRWSQAMLTSMLLLQSYESGQPSHS